MAVNDDGQKGTFGSARALLGRVVGRVVDAALGTTRQPRGDHGSDERAAFVRAETVPAMARVEAPPMDMDGQSNAGDVRVALTAAGDDRVVLSWRLSTEAIARARRVLGAEGELCARLVVVSPDDEEVVMTRVREHADVKARGEWVVTNLPSGALCAAAVGLARDERFVSAGHAQIVRV